MRTILMFIFFKYLYACCLLWFMMVIEAQLPEELGI